MSRPSKLPNMGTNTKDTSFHTRPIGAWPQSLICSKMAWLGNHGYVLMDLLVWEKNSNPSYNACMPLTTHITFINKGPPRVATNGALQAFFEGFDEPFGFASSELDELPDESWNFKDFCTQSSFRFSCWSLMSTLYCRHAWI